VNRQCPTHPNESFLTWKLYLKTKRCLPAHHRPDDSVSIDMIKVFWGSQTDSQTSPNKKIRKNTSPGFTPKKPGKPRKAELSFLVSLKITQEVPK
jgi:hypothetical protein